MTGVELQTSGVRIDHSANRASTISLCSVCQIEHSIRYLFNGHSRPLLSSLSRTQKYLNNKEWVLNRRSRDLEATTLPPVPEPIFKCFLLFETKGRHDCSAPKNFNHEGCALKHFSSSWLVEIDHVTKVSFLPIGWMGSCDRRLTVHMTKIDSGND